MELRVNSARDTQFCQKVVKKNRKGYNGIAQLIAIIKKLCF